MARLAPLFALVLAACGDPAASSDPPPTSPEVGRSPDETEPSDEPAPAVDVSGAALAAQHAEATRVLDAEPARAAGMLGAACDRGLAASCVALADLLERGAPGVDVDEDRARGLLEQACFDGSTVACDRLGH